MKNRSNFVTVFIVSCAITLSVQDIPPAVFEVKIFKSEGSTPEGNRVYGAKQCGGPGEFIEFRIQGCAPNVTCQLKANGNSLVAEIDFIPVINMTQMRYKLSSIVDMNPPMVLHDGPVANSAVQKGVKHTVQISQAAGMGIKGKRKSVHELFNVADDSLRVCMDADIEWI